MWNYSLAWFKRKSVLTSSHKSWKWGKIRGTYILFHIQSTRTYCSKKNVKSDCISCKHCMLTHDKQMKHAHTTLALRRLGVWGRFGLAASWPQFGHEMCSNSTAQRVVQQVRDQSTTDRADGRWALVDTIMYRVVGFLWCLWCIQLWVLGGASAATQVLGGGA